MKLTLQREPSRFGWTLGRLNVNGVFECYTCEDVVREVPNVPVAEWKVPGATAIPIGHYGIIIDASTRFHRLMPHILNVPGFNGIRIHSGNTAADTEGCILVGTEFDDKGIAGGCSRPAFERLFEKMKLASALNEPISIDILPPSAS